MKVQCLQVGAIETNCYLLCDEAAQVCAIVDPGDEAARIAAAVRKSGCTPSAVLLTHGHYDHTGGVAGLRQMWPGLPVYLHSGDTPGMGAPEMLFPAIPGTTHYAEGDTVSVGGLAVKVLYTPGHSKGSVSLLCDTVLFSGDTLFAGDCGRTDLWGGDMDEMLHSLGRLGLLDGDLTVCPGHMDMSSLERERKRNPWVRQGMRMLQS